MTDNKKSFDPFDATYNDAVELDEISAFDTGDVYYSGHVIKQSVADQIKRMKDIITEKKDGFALLQAIRMCACNDLLMPTWLAKEYIKRFDKVLNCHAGSWDEAFGKPYPGKHLEKLRQRRNLRPAIGNRIFNIRLQEPETPIDKGFFERVGEEFGIGATYTEELYREFFQGFTPVKKQSREK